MKKEIVNKLNLALEKLLKNEKEIILSDVNERSLSHRLAIYLQEHFEDWDIDCEYNRDYDLPKQLVINSRNHSSDDIHARTVFPDIIIHKRGTDKNLLVLEMKKTSNPESDDFDMMKLNAFRKQLKYQYAVFVKIQVYPKATVKHIEWVP
jgi:hypothetical protein